MKKTFICVVSSLMLIFAGGQAPASTVTATAELDLTSLLGMTNFRWTVSSQTDALASNTMPVFQSASTGPTNGWSVAESTATISNADASGFAAEGIYSSYASAYEPSNTMPYAAANASGGGSFTYSGADGNVRFTIPYLVSMVLKTDNSPEAWTYGSYKVWFGITGGSYIEAFSQSSFVNGASSSESDQSSFIFDVPLHTGQKGTIDFGTATGASAYAIPEPATLWFLGLGLAGLAGFRRRWIQP